MQRRTISMWAAVAALALAPAVLPAQVADRMDVEGFLRLAGVESRSYLGVGVQEVDSERAKTLKLKEERGVEITRVEDESPAAKAGLKVADVVLEYNGERVEGTEQFIRLVRETPAGRNVKLLVHRAGAPVTLAAVIGVRKGPMILSGPMEWKGKAPEVEVVIPDIPKAMMSWRSSMLGVEAESLGESQLSDFFGVKEGVLVRSVMKNTSAERAGFKAGDVILKVGDEKVTTPRDVTAAVRSARSAGKKSVAAVIMRDKRETTINIPLDEEPTGTLAPTPKAVPRVGLRQMKL